MLVKFQIWIKEDNRIYLCSLPGSSVHGIFQARVLKWGAIAFSNNILTTALMETVNIPVVDI